LDVHLGNVVSLVLLPDDGEHTQHTIAHSAEKFGLTLFSCVAILSPGTREFLGTFETYCCFSRKPTLHESQLVEQAARLAALAIQQYNHDIETEDWPLDWTGATGRGPCEGPPSTN
jgi:GAF domain-containing protein